MGSFLWLTFSCKIGGGSIGLRSAVFSLVAKFSRAEKKNPGKRTFVFAQCHAGMLGLLAYLKHVVGDAFESIC